MRATEFITDSIGDKRTDAAGSDEYVINKYLVKFTPSEILFYKGGELVYKKPGDYSNVTRGDVSVATKITTMLWEKAQQGLVPNMEYSENIEKLVLLKRELDVLIRKSTYGSYERRKYTKKYNEASQQLKHLKSTQSEWKKSEPSPVAEVFEPGKTNWKWRQRGSEEATADFTVGDRTYQWHAYSHVRAGNPTKWEMQFRLIRNQNDPDDLDLFGTTGTGNSAEVLSTAVDITRAFLEEYGLNKVEEIMFSAKENSRIALYAKMIKRLLPSWDLYQKYTEYNGMEYHLTDRRAYDKPENKIN